MKQANIRHMTDASNLYTVQYYGGIHHNLKKCNYFLVGISRNAISSTEKWWNSLCLTPIRGSFSGYNLNLYFLAEMINASRIHIQTVTKAVYTAATLLD